MSIDKLPYVKAPCGNCPFRKDSRKGWLGEERAKEIAESDSFVCHKNTKLQCAGHMVVCENNNEFVRMAEIFYKEKPPIKNKQVLLKKPIDFIKHHKR